nr:HAD family hydrolase [uncultured Arsenicibacter sp.]
MLQTSARKLLILDLDETLIYATEQPLAHPADFRFDRYFVYKRPYVAEFLSAMASHYSLGIWSSADDDYVEALAGQIRPDSVSIEIVWGRSRCSVRRDIDSDIYCYEKRLAKLKKRGFQLKDILIVDDSPEKLRTNYGNAIYIKSFTGETDDEELRYLQTYLIDIKDTDNVRVIEKRYWRSRFPED